MRKKVLRYFGWVCAELILLGVIIACIFEIPRNIEAKKVVDKGVIVEAEVTGVGGHDSLYHLHYTYYGENGFVYEGASFSTYRYHEAYALIGTTIPIYIGENGISVSVGYEPSIVGYVILIPIVSVIFIALNTIFVSYFLKRRKQSKIKLQEDSASPFESD